MTTGQEVAAVAGNEHRVLWDFAAPMHLVHGRPVLDVRYRGEITGATEIELKLRRGAASAPALCRVWNHRPPEAEMGRELARDFRFPVAIDAIGVAKHVPAA